MLIYLRNIFVLCKEINIFAPNSIIIDMADINRLKVVLVEKKRTSKWLAETLGKDPATVSKWCTNASQPSIETFLEIARLLDVDIKDLLMPSEGNRQYNK